MSLGDKFPRSVRDEFVGRQATPGSVLYLYCNFTTPPKMKYLLVAARDPIPLLFVINSRIHQFVADNQNLNRCQVMLDEASHEFLAHDSFIDCSDVKREWGAERFHEKIAENPGCVVGHISDEVRSNVIAAVKGADTISQRQANLILSALERA